VHALTLRIPIEDYNVLRADAFVRDLSINEVVLEAIRTAIGPDRRDRLQHVLDEAQATQFERGRPTDLPRNPNRKVGVRQAPIGVRLAAFSGAR
jgi:hypothetical protein